jgi:hypothetical protein
MAFKAFRGSPFNHSHENKVFNDLYDLLSEKWNDRDDNLYLFGNFFVAGKEFDALIVKNNAIIIVDFKNFGGDLEFSENGVWKCDGLTVKGGNSRNPFLQLRSNKFALLEYVKGGHVELLSKPNLGHIAGLVVFHQSINFDDNQIPQQIKSWFHVCDFDHVLRTIDGIASAEINLPIFDIEAFVEAFGTDEYFPDGKLKTKNLMSLQTDDSAFTHLGAEENALEQFYEWVKSDKNVYVLKGMVSTGKRTLLKQFVRYLEQQNQSMLLIAPNARLAKKYTSLGVGEFVSIYQFLYSNVSDETIQKSNGVELAKYPIKLTNEELEGKVLIFVDAHLISNSYFDLESSILGSGHLVNDLLSVFADKPPKAVAIGDPYQLTRGKLDECLLFGNGFKHFELGVVEVHLEQQIQSEPEDLHEFQFEIAQQIELQQYSSLPYYETEHIKILENDPNIGIEITSSPYQAVYLTGLNSTAHKVNLAAKQKVLKQVNPNVLNVGDLVDFHTSTPIVSNNDDLTEEAFDWVQSGEIARVTEVSPDVETIEFSLKGRDAPTMIRMGAFSCSVARLGQVKIKYLVDYLDAEKPEMSTDQVLVLNIVARKDAEYRFRDLKDKVQRLKDQNTELYKSEKKKYTELINQYLKNSPFLNAAKIRYAYAMTVHRAQGRVWEKVYLDASRGPSGDSITNDGYFRFLYTATICTEGSVGLLKYPKLTPLYSTQFMPNQNCKIGAFSLSEGFDYEMPDVRTLENFSPPVGFDSSVNELKALSYAISQKINATDWHIKEVKQHSYQELYSFVHSSGVEIRVRFTYDKNVLVKTLVFVDESKEPQLSSELKKILTSSPKLKNERLNKALEQIKRSVEPHGYSVIVASERSEYEILVGLMRDVDLIELKVYVTKDGFISKVFPERASSQGVLDFFKEFFNE